MEIGEPQREITIEPITIPEYVPVEAPPEKVPEKVPA